MKSWMIVIVIVIMIVIVIVIVIGTAKDHNLINGQEVVSGNGENGTS